MEKNDGRNLPFNVMQSHRTSEDFVKRVKFVLDEWAELLIRAKLSSQIIEK